jgi:hypothetical protein
VGHDDDDDFIQDKAASPPLAVSPPRHTPTPPAAQSPPQIASSNYAATSSANADNGRLIGTGWSIEKQEARWPTEIGPTTSAEEKSCGHKIPKMTKLSYEKTDEELNASVKAEVKAFFKKTKADAQAKQEKPYLMYHRVKLCQVVQAMQDEKHASRLSDYERTITKKIKEDKRKQKAVGKDVAQLSQQAQQSVPPLVVENQYGSNMNLMQISVPDDVDLDELAKWMNVTGLSLEQLLGRENLTTVK